MEQDQIDDLDAAWGDEGYFGMKGDSMDEITMEEWKQIEMDFGWTKDDFDAEAEPVTMSPQGVEGQTYEMPGILDDPNPKKAWMYLSQAWTGTSTGSGWRAYSRKGDASRYGGKETEKKITLFDDGTWSYGLS